MSDISIAIDSSLLKKLFDSLKYPWRKKITPSFIGAKRFADDLAVSRVEQTSEGDDLIDGSGYIDDFINVYLDERQSIQTRGASESALLKLLDPYGARIQTNDAEARKSIKAQLLADDKGGDRLEAFFQEVFLKKKKSASVSVDWIEFELTQPPGSTLGNPIMLTGLKIGVRAKVSVCVRVFGRQICLRITTPWFRIEGRRVEASLTVDQLKLIARAKVDDVDFVIKIKIGPFKFKIKIGVTGHINRYLSQQAPVLVDASNVAIVVPGLGKTFVPISIGTPPHASITQLQMDGKFK